MTAGQPADGENVEQVGWSVVRRWRKSGQRWWLAVAGQYATRDPRKAIVYSDKRLAEEVAEQERRDASWRGNDFDVYVEPAPLTTASGRPSDA